MKRFFPFAIIVIVLAGALAAGWYWRKAAHKDSTGSAAGIPPIPAASPAPGAEPPHVRGSEKATVTLEEFGDFECPSCGLFYPVLKTIEGEYGARLRVIFRELPLTTPDRKSVV